MIKKLPLIDYLTYFLKTYQQAQELNAPKHAYRLVDVKENNQGEYILSIQVIGTSNIFKATLNEILSDDKVIEHFSSKDIRAISLLSKNTPQVKPVKSEILSQTINDDNQIVFELKHNETNLIVKKTAKEISLNEPLIDSLSPRDAHKIGYTSAYELPQN